MSPWDYAWNAVRAASRVSTEHRNAAMRVHHILTVSDMADAARLSVSQTRRILHGYR